MAGPRFDLVPEGENHMISREGTVGHGWRLSPLLFCALTSLIAMHLVCRSVAFASPQPRIVIFSAWDHRFDGPDSIHAGQTTIRLHNRGHEPHQLQLLKLEDGKSPSDLAAVLQQPGHAIPSWAKHMGGPNGVGSGEKAEATVYLEPGSYVVICIIPAENHKTHAALGMQKTLRVTDHRPSPPDFHGNFHMAMLDYEFVVVQPLRRGEHTFYVVNRGSQPHQVSVVRLNPGASSNDVLTSFETGKIHSLPGQLIGGMSGLEPDAEGTFTADFSPGRYAMICLFPNPAARDSHAAKGMVMHFTIE